MKINTGTILLRTWKEFFLLTGRFMSGEWIFRGQAQSEWVLSTSFERNRQAWLAHRCNRDKVLKKKSVPVILNAYLGSISSFVDEKSAIDDFMKYVDSRQIAKDDYISCLALMQHYGAPTRLLDFSDSIYSALYFAYESITGYVGPRAIWAVKMNPIYIHLSSIVNEFSKKINGDIQAVYDNIADLNVNGELHRVLGVKFGVIPVRAPGNNSRIDAQSGLFLCPISCDSFASNLAASLGTSVGFVNHPPDVGCGKVMRSFDKFSMLKIEMPESMYEEVPSVLKLANINSRHLFPGLEGVAKSIHYRYK